MDNGFRVPLIGGEPQNRAYRLRARSLSFLRYAVVISFTVVAITTALVTLVYVQMRSEVVALLSSANERAVEQVRDTTDLVFDQSVSLLHRIFVDDNIQPLLFGTAISPVDMAAGIENLRGFALTNPDVQSIYIINRAANRIFTSAGAASMYELRGFYDSDIVSILSGSRRVPLWSPLARLAPGVPGRTGDVVRRPVFTFVFAELERPGHRVNHAIVLNLDTTWFSALLRRSAPTPGATVVRDHNGGAVFAPVGDGWDEAFDTIATDAIDRSVQRSGSMDLDDPAGRIVVSFAKSPRSDWTFVSVQRVESLLAAARRTLQTIVIVAGAIIAVGVLFSIGVSAMLYRPVGVLQEQITDLREREADHQEHERALFVDRLMHVPSRTLGLEASDVFRHIPEAEAATAFRAVVIRVDEHPVAPESLVACLQRNASAVGATTVAHVSDPNRVAALMLSLPPGDQQTLERLFAEIVSEMGPGVSIGMSDTATDFSRLGTYLEQAESALAHRVFTGARNAVRYSDVPSRQDGFALPADLGFKITEALLAGNVDAACERCSSAIGATRRYGVPALQSTILRIASAVLRTVDVLGVSSIEESYRDADRLTREMTQQPTLERLAEYCCACCHALVRAAAETPRGAERAVATCRRAVKEEYADPNLSLSLLADRVGLSPTYMGRLFKRVHGVSVSDFLTRMRMEEAQRLLVHTTMTVKQIAHAVGFPNEAYFYTRFKRNSGMTPRAYRRREHGTDSPSQPFR